MELAPIMIAHVTFGGVALLSGFLALLMRKGRLVHRIAGRVFVFSMVVMALLGSSIAYQKPEMITVLAGLLTAYLVISALITVRNTSLLSTWFGLVLSVFAFCVGVAGLFYGAQAIQSVDKMVDGFPAEPYFFFGGLAIFAAVFDSKVFANKGIEALFRINRHAWRMCVALLIAAASFFDGPGAKVFPEALQGSFVLSLPILLVLVLLIYWLVRILVFKKAV